MSAAFGKRLGAGFGLCGDGRDKSDPPDPLVWSSSRAPRSFSARGRPVDAMRLHFRAKDVNRGGDQSTHGASRRWRRSVAALGLQLRGGALPHSRRAALRPAPGRSHAPAPAAAAASSAARPSSAHRPSASLPSSSFDPQHSPALDRPGCLVRLAGSSLASAHARHSSTVSWQAESRSAWAPALGSHGELRGRLRHRRAAGTEPAEACCRCHPCTPVPLARAAFSCGRRSRCAC